MHLVHQAYQFLNKIRHRYCALFHEVYSNFNFQQTRYNSIKRLQLLLDKPGIYRIGIAMCAAPLKRHKTICLIIYILLDSLML